MGLHLGGLISDKTVKTWGTYDYTLIAKRNYTPYYNIAKNWFNLQRLFCILQNSSKSPTFNIFFGSLTNALYDILNTASLHCGATFYGKSETWVYGTYSRNFYDIVADISFIPDMWHNHALMREVYPRLGPIVGINTTDSLQKFDYPLIGNPQNIIHILFYTQIIVSILSKK